MKIELFSKMVIEKNLSEDRKSLDALNIKHAKILDDMEVKCQMNRMKYLENIEEKVKEKKRKLLSKTQSEIQNQIIVKRNELLNKLKADLIDALEIETKSGNYKSNLNTKLTRALSKFEEKDNLVIGIRAQDLIAVPTAIETRIDDQILGGFYIIKSNREKYDYTLISEVNAIDDYLGCMINALFESSVEACDEN